MDVINSSRQHCGEVAPFADEKTEAHGDSFNREESHGGVW